ncbi:RagB/SusD family nutrient uptake outer membrane protein [Gaoshiqia sp. Z1-71]|uniref:RagB/SusD family nutrient uptake outer membrane protein n=1 Tax=Gaoshiqia hydrogeniformans TaxID=3290090 RepID=UPI003BF79947
MRTKLIYLIAVLFNMGIFTACESLLDDVEQQGTTSIENFYKTDSDAEEAIASVYFQWRSQAFNDFFLKNTLSDDIYSGGGSRGDNSTLEQLSEYRFSTSNSTMSDYFSGLYTLIYRSNLVINNFTDDTEAKRRAIAEAKVARGWAYLNLVTLWGPVPFVTSQLAPSEYQQPNGTLSEIWGQIETDLSEAAASGALPEKASEADKSVGGRLSKQAALSFLGKAQVFQGKYSEAATTLKSVINSGKYKLIDNYENVLRKVEDFGPENIFEVNSINDGENAFNQGTTILGNMYGWRSDRLNLNGYWFGAHDLYPGGWGFANPRENLYNAFVEMEGTAGYRLNATVKTYQQVMTIGAPAAPVTVNAGTSLYGHEGYFNWKWRFLGSEVIPNSWGLATDNNYRIMRYAEVLLLAAESCLLSGDGENALNYINQIRNRAQLPALSAVTLDDIKKEKRLELCIEQVRFQDLVRWGDAATALAEQGKQVPVFTGLREDGTHNVSYPYSNTAYGFKAGKHELLPFPEHEMNVNSNLTQNTGW